MKNKPSTILIVDDEELTRRFFSSALSDQGYAVKTASNAKEAVENIDDCQLALVDIKLPDASGLDLIDRIREKNPAIETILVTGYPSVETAVQALGKEIFAYLPKPVQLDQLYGTVQRALEKQKLLGENRRLIEELRNSNELLSKLNLELEGKVRERTRRLAESEQEAKHQARELAMINGITKAISSSLSLKSLFETVVREIGRIVAFDRASITLVDKEQRVNRVYFLKPESGEKITLAENFPIEGTGIEQVVQNRKILIRSDLTGAAKFSEDSFIQQTGVKSGMVIPLIYQDRVIGTLNLGSMVRNAFSIDHENILKQAAGQLAAALENATLYLEHTTRDHLTGTLNRKQLLPILTEEFIRADRYHRHLTVAMVDIDGFKEVNDTQGHLAGDKILKEMGKLILTSIRRSDTAIRYGGDEFFFIFPEIGSRQAFSVIDRIREVTARTPHKNPSVEGADYYVTLSGGITQLSPEDTELEDLIKRADQALYKAKEKGRNRVVTL